MTVEEIKEKYSMSDILAECGLPQPNRAGFVHCPFHKGDREPSMKIYQHDYHCYGCGANGDIFTFLQAYYRISFKDAFHLLGGTYEKPTFRSKLAVYKAQKAREMRQKQVQKEAEKRSLNNMLISIYQRYLPKYEPLSDAWCETYNALQYQLYIHEVLNERRTDK